MISRCLLFAVTLATSVVAQTPSGAKPELNQKFRDPNLKVEEWAQKFETESREIFHQRAGILKAAGLKPGLSVADIGAGTGLFTLPFAAEVGPEGKVYAVEISPKFIEHIKARAVQEKAANVQTVLCTDKSVELPEASVDVAFLCDVYHHFEHPQESLQSFFRARKPGGTLLLIDFIRVEGRSTPFIMGHVRAGQEVFEKEVTAAGFERVEEIKGLLVENYCVRFRKPLASKP